MPKVVFLESEHGRQKEVDAPAGGHLIDICDDARAPVDFSCRSASCGTCRLEVVVGAEFLEPPKTDEEDTLDIMDSKPTMRLACQTVVKSGDGAVHVRWVGV